MAVALLGSVALAASVAVEERSLALMTPVALVSFAGIYLVSRRMVTLGYIVREHLEWKEFFIVAFIGGVVGVLWILARARWS